MEISGACGHGQWALDARAGAQGETWAGLVSVAIIAIRAAHACVSGLLVSGWRRALRQKATVLKWLCLVWERCPEVMSGLTRATRLSTAVCGGLLSVKTAVEIR